MIRPSQKQWNDFVKYKLDYESDISNVREDFTKLSKTSGVCYFEFLRCQWLVSKDIMTVEEFCKMNGGVPLKVFEKNVRIAETDPEYEVVIS